jgi:Uma2 family endonuclease
MTQAAKKARCTFAEYLAFEKASETKHEFMDGEIFALPASTPEHAALAANVIAGLRPPFRDWPCRVCTSDVRVRVLATGLVAYPDVTVVRGKFERDPEDPDTLVNPIVLVEVLSDSREAYDRGRKFVHYRRIPSLRGYVLVCQKEKRIELYQRDDTGSWTLRDAGLGEIARIMSIGCDLSVDEVYWSPFIGQSES